MDVYQQNARSQVDCENDEYENLPTKTKASIALFKNLANTLQRQQFCDFVFELTGSVKFHTHRLVVALWSPVVMNLLTQTASRVEKVLVKTNHTSAFTQFVHFLYTGNFEDNVRDIPGVLLLASTFQIPLLRDLCEKRLLQTISVDNVISLFHISVHYQLTRLEIQCVDYLRQHLPEVAQQSELKDLNPEQFNTFLASQHVSKLNPEMKLFLIISWLTEHVTERQHFLVLLLGHIDWSTVAQDFLTEIRQTENFFTSHPSSLYLLLQTLHSASIPLGPYQDRFEELRKEHSEILENVVMSSVQIGNGRHEIFQPISLTVITASTSNLDNSAVNVKKKPLNVRNNSQSKTRVKTSTAVRRGGFDEVKVPESRATAESVESRRMDKSGLGQTRNDRITPSIPLDEGENDKTLPVQSSQAISERRSMRRKTLRPRKVVSPSSASIIQSKSMSTRPSRVGQRGKDGSIGCGSTTDDPQEQQPIDFEIDIDQNKLFIKLEDNGDDVADEDDDVEEEDDDEEVNAPASKHIKKGFGKGKVGRPRKGFEKSKFFCSQCEYITRHSNLLEKHVQQVHESKKIIKCPVCDFQCSWSKKLYMHMRADHYNNQGPPFLCDVPDCSFSIDKMNKLVDHRRSHTGDRPFMCDQCKMCFRSKSNLYAHLKCHNGDVFPCTFPSCSYSTPKKSTLQAHMRSHLGIRQHVCNVCNKAFIEKSHLIRHKRIHTSEKQHKCTLCDYASHRQDKLREHMQKHEREASRRVTAADHSKERTAEPKKRKRKKKEETNKAAKDTNTNTTSSLPVETEDRQETTVRSSTSALVANQVGQKAASPDLDLNDRSAAASSGSVLPPHFPPYNHSYGPSPKQEKEWTDLELLTRMGFAVADGQNPASSSTTARPASVAVRIRRSGDTAGSVTSSSNSCMSEFPDVFKGFVGPPSSGSSVPSVAHHMPESQSQSQTRVNNNQTEAAFSSSTPHNHNAFPNVVTQLGMSAPSYISHHPHQKAPHHQSHHVLQQQQQQQLQQHDDDHHYLPRQHQSSISQQQQQQQHVLSQQGNDAPQAQHPSNFTHFHGYNHY